MIFNRKFYDIGQADVGAAEVIEKTGEAPKTVAEAMAKFGRNSSGGDEGSLEPIQISEIKEETKATETDTPAETATAEVKVEKVETETPKPDEAKVESSQSQTEIKEEKQPEQKSWQEVIKEQQPKAVLQAIGFDEKLTDLADEMKDFKGEELSKAINLLKSVKEGKAQDYLRELTTDYTKMPSEDVMRHQLQKEYPKASPKQLDALYKTEVIQKYNLDSTDEDEKEEGQLLLDVKADKYRDDFLANQKNFLTPVASEPIKEETKADPAIEAEKQLLDSVTKQLKEDSYTQSLIASNKFTLGEGDEKFSFPVDGKELAEIAIHGDKNGDLLFEITKDADGKETWKPRTQHQLLVAAVTKYGEPFLIEYAKHYKSLGGKKVIEAIDNAKETEQKIVSDSEAEPKTPAEAMARRGVLNNGS